MIVAMHAPIPNTNLNSYILSTDSLLTAPGIGLFIMVSGALLLPVNISTEQFLKKRFSKIVGPTLFWSLVYFFMAPVTETVDQGHGLISLLSIPFSPQFNSVLWFMYMLSGLYLLSPIISPWLKYKGRKEIKFYLCLWGITMCYPLLRDFIVVNEGHTGILYYFGGYVGYFLLGYYLKNYVNKPLWVCLLLFVIPVMIAACVKLFHVLVDFYDMFWYLSIFVAMMSTALFLSIKRINVDYDSNIWWQEKTVLISNCCFGIYLVHILVMRSFLWKLSLFQEMSGIIQIILVTIITFLISFIITWGVSFLPFAEYIIGFRQKKSQL